MSRRFLVLGGNPPWAALIIAIALMTGTASASEPAAGSSAWFDARIAPLLARRCLSCHDGSSPKGGLDLSREQSTRGGGDSGPAIEATKPDDSLLWSRVDSDEMPPKEPLSADEKHLLREWIANGARWGAGEIDPFRFSSEKRAGYDWWSVQPLTNPVVPTVSDQRTRNEIDNFVLDKLKAEGLSPAAEANPRILVRRLYFDLIGLPPSPKEMRQWTVRLSAKDSADKETAYRQLVDHLLDSPHYGERWARHWLDVVRFGESQGFERNRIRENAWRYRDWVIAAFNKDMPYDEFVRQQIAGDVLYPENLDALIATGFHVCGTWDQVGHLEGSAEMQKAVRQDHIEDLVATVGQAFLGLTINCARCHDHKFDPISQREYYQMAALLGGVTQGKDERQNITYRDDARDRWQAEINAKRQELQQLEETLRDHYGSKTEGVPIDGLQALFLPDAAADSSKGTIVDQSGVGEPLDLTEEGSKFASVGPATKLIASAKQAGELTVETWITPGKAKQTGPARIVTISLDSGQRNFTLGHDGSHFDIRLRTTKTDGNGMPSLPTPDGTAANRHTHVVVTFDRQGVCRVFVDGKQVAERKTGGGLSNWNDGFRLALGDELSGGRKWDGQFHFVALYSTALSAEQITRNFQSQSKDVRAGQPFAEVLASASESDLLRHGALAREMEQLKANEPAPKFGGVAHVIIPKQPPVFHVLDRGDFRKPLDVVKPAGLAALTSLPADFGLQPDAPEAERRKQLASWLTHPSNPLVARVFVNRLWHYHFGSGIVHTPSDFGFSGDRPTHPELLDWLANTFIQQGWSIKQMHRLMVNSATYRQASNVKNDKAQSVDAGNRLLWRANPRRLEGEAVRDAVLTVSGVLNRKMGGPSYRDMKVDGGRMGTNAEFTVPTGEFGEEVNRRTIYRLWARSGNNPLLESLDCPDPSVMLPQRTQTITPVQSLSMLNNRLMEQCAASLAGWLGQQAGSDADGLISLAYFAVYCREPKPVEIELARPFVREHGIEQLCLVLFNTNEFLFIE